MRKRIVVCLFLLFSFSYSSITTQAAVLPSSATSLPSGEPDPAAIKAALKEFKALSKKEKKHRLKQAKQAIKDFKKERKKGNDPSTDTLLLVIIALLIPPLAVYLHQGETNQKFWITTLLFVIGILGAFLLSWVLLLGAIIYALIVILGNG